MPTKNTKYYSLLVVLADIVTLFIAFSLSYIIRVIFDNRPLVSPVYAFEYFQASLVIAGPGAPKIEGTMEYRLQNRRARLNLSSLELHTLTGADIETADQSKGTVRLLARHGHWLIDTIDWTSLGS